MLHLRWRSLMAWLLMMALNQLASELRPSKPAMRLCPVWPGKKRYAGKPSASSPTPSVGAQTQAEARCR